MRQIIDPAFKAHFFNSEPDVFIECQQLLVLKQIGRYLVFADWNIRRQPKSRAKQARAKLFKPFAVFDKQLIGFTATLQRFTKFTNYRQFDKLSLYLSR